MDKKELRESVIEMYEGDPEVSTARDLEQHMIDAGTHGVREQDLLAVLEELVAQGLLQKAGRMGYEATEHFMQLVEDGEHVV